MTILLKAILAASSVAALAAWIRRANRPRLNDGDGFDDMGRIEDDSVEIDDDAAADIIRRARPELERARELTRQG
jgi:hypothetical protein